MAGLYHLDFRGRGSSTASLLSLGQNGLDRIPLHPHVLQLCEDRGVHDYPAVHAKML